MSDVVLFKLWIVALLSVLAPQITGLSMQLYAVSTLGAGPVEVGLLNALGQAPYLLLTPFVGLAIDRWSKRSVLVPVALSAAAVLLVLALSQQTGTLTFLGLSIAAVGLGAVTVLWSVAIQPFVVGLIGRPRLLAANSRLQLANAVGRIAGPALAGVLVAASASVAFGTNAVLYGLAASVVLMLPRDAVASAGKTPGRFWPEFRAGWTLLFRNPTLRAVTFAAAIYNFAAAVMLAVFVLFATHDLGLGVEAVGVVFTLGQMGWLIGPFLAPRIARVIGLGRSIIVLLFIDAIVEFGIPAAPGQGMQAAIWLSAIFVVHSVVFSAWSVQAGTLRQALLPDHAMSRATAAFIFVSFGVVPLGGLAGGLLGESIGLRPTLLVGALAMQAMWVWAVLSPLRLTSHIPVEAPM